MDKENVNTTNCKRTPSAKKPGRKKDLSIKEKPKVEISKKIHPAAKEIIPAKTQHIQESQDKEKLQSMVQQWRAERQARLMSRLMKKCGSQGGCSSALFGTVPASDQVGQASTSKKVAPKTIDPATRRSTVHAFRVKPEALKTPQQPLRKVPSTEKRPSTTHIFTAKPATAQPPRFPYKAPSTTRLTRPRTTATVSRQVKETVPKEAAAKVDGPKTGCKGKSKLVIRHTLASRMRLEKANPLMGVEAASRPNSVPVTKPSDDKPGPSGTMRSRTASVPTIELKTPLKAVTDNPKKPPVASHIVQKRLTLGESSQKRAVSLERPKSGAKKSAPCEAIPARVSSRPSSIRRSLSSTYLDRLDKKDFEKYVIRSQSEPNVKDAEEQQTTLKFQGLPSPITEEPSEPIQETPRTVPRVKKSVTFTTPMANTSGSCFTPEPEVLRKRLIAWLSKRGKSLDNYHHLNCFGIHAKSMGGSRFSLPIKRTPKPSMNSSLTPVKLDETITLEPEDSSPEEAKMDTTIVSSIHRSPLAAIDLNETITTSTPNNSPQMDVECSDESNEKENTRSKGLFIPDTLGDLYKLIQLGFPRDQCDEWLVLIRRANKGITDMPQYWECLAALEEARGDFSAAIDCYGRAVVRGAETTKIEASLEVLWDKFSALNISNTTKKTPKRQNVDPKQVFTSSIIKFALQQRAVKRLSSDLGVEAASLDYVITPVRRSTRKSTSQFRSTPTHTVFSKLEEIAPGVLNAMMFKKNSALEPQD